MCSLGSFIFTSIVLWMFTFIYPCVLGSCFPCLPLRNYLVTDLGRLLHCALGIIAFLIAKSFCWHFCSFLAAHSSAPFHPGWCVTVPYNFCGSIFSLLFLCCYSHALAPARPGIVDSRLHGKSLPLAFLSFPPFLSLGGPIERLSDMHVQSLTVCSTCPWSKKGSSIQCSIQTVLYMETTYRQTDVTLYLLQ